MNIAVKRLKSIIMEEVSEMRKKVLREDEGSDLPKQNPSQMLQTLDDIDKIFKWVNKNMGEPEYGDPLETEERMERLDDLITVLYNSLSDLVMKKSDEDGYSKVGGTRPMQEGDEEPDAQEVHDAWVDVGKFLAKLYNQGQDELAADLDKILTRFQAAGAIPRKAGIEEADEGGPGVHDIMNLPEPEAVESSGNPKEDAIRQIVASSSRGRVDGQMLDLFSAGRIVTVLNALSPGPKADYLKMPVARMAEIAFELTK